MTQIKADNGHVYISKCFTMGTKGYTYIIAMYDETTGKEAFKTIVERISINHDTTVKAVERAIENAICRAEKTEAIIPLLNYMGISDIHITPAILLAIINELKTNIEKRRLNR